MAYVAACLRGQMGDTQFFTVKMKAGEAVRALRRAQESDDWAQMGIEERLQRELAVTRVYREVAPYIAGSKDRFFGALIVIVYKGDVFFEPIKSFKAEIPRAYQAQTEDMGFITIEGGELIVLDGQHRLEGLRYAINGRGKMSETGREGEITGEFVGTDVANDDVNLIIFKHESLVKTRNIFNRVNRYAKSISAGDNIITSEDDACAIVSRHLLEKGAPLGGIYKGEMIVNWRSNTLPERSTKFTTISAVYDTVEAILRADAELKHLVVRKATGRPSQSDLDAAFSTVAKFWQAVLESLEPYRRAIGDPGLISEMRQPASSHSLLFKPAAQTAFFEALVRARDLSRLPLEDVLKRAALIPWSMKEPLWMNIIMKPDLTINAQKEPRARTADFIEYLLVGDKMTKKRIAEAKISFNAAHGHYLDPKKKGFPSKLEDQAHLLPLDLPSRDSFKVEV